MYMHVFFDVCCSHVGDRKMSGGPPHMYDKQPCVTSTRISIKAGSLFEGRFPSEPATQWPDLEKVRWRCRRSRYF